MKEGVVGGGGIVSAGIICDFCEEETEYSEREDEENAKSHH